ncbi:AmpG family muropeptide MFS transporter [Desulfosoma caldarium]|uniref:PAT family beta-lactamase induction signal transducer AmpG n=1 Tax=Desulfosoma caldarium TaxID=610254 RepID=A0A3N1UQS1_9BACT|nr:AmpG family muropeptide MFS transporter [Desulfosoma caldarium]ROQ93452.1 PAT family beta-lactamase induction signal transducer AmpG [Desulfosoma caldarium]
MSSSWLCVYGRRHVLGLLGLGFSSGLPLALTGSTLQAWMMSEKVDIRLIGLFSLVGLPYTLKVAWAPLMDRFTAPWLGRRRGWILTTQILLSASLLILGSLTPSRHLQLMGALAFIIAFWSASQDIVIDAYRAEVLPDADKGAGAAMSVVGYRLAMLTSGAMALILSDHLPWRTVYLSMGMLMGACTLWTFLCPEPANSGEAAELGPKNLKETVWAPLTNYFTRPGAVAILVFVMVFKLSDALAGALTTPFLLDLGFTRTDVGTVNKAFGLVSTIVGTLIGGALVHRLGIARSLWVAAFLQAFSNLAFVGLALAGPNYAFLVGAVALENLCGGLGTAAFLAFLMSLCDRRYTATQYALLSSLMAVSRVLAGTPTGFLVAALGWPWFYTLSVLGAVPGIVLLPRFAPWRRPPSPTTLP